MIKLGCHMAVVMIGCLLRLGLPLTMAQEAEAIPLIPFTTQIAPLDDLTPVYRYEFQATAGSVWSFSAEAVALSGDVDPVLRLFDESGQLLAANDNESRLSLNARLEQWLAPNTESYILELSRDAQTEGFAILTAVQDANSVVLSRLPMTEQITLNAGQVYDLAETINPQQLPLYVTFRAEWAAEDTLALQMTAGHPLGVGDWLLTITAAGLSLQETQADPTVENGTFQTVLFEVTQPIPQGTYTLEMEAQNLTIAVDNEPITTLATDSLPTFRFIRSGSQQLRLLAMPNNIAPVQIQRPYASAAFYGVGVSLSDALPPALAGERLYTYREIPLTVIAELRELGYLGEGGGLAFSIPEGIIETADLGFSSVPLGMAEGFGNMVMGFTTTARLGGAGVACGLTFRQVDEASFVTVLVSEDGNAYILPYVDGDLLGEGLAVHTPWVNLGLGAENHVLILAEGEQASLFVNGYWVGETTVPAASGNVLLTTVLNSPEVSRCTYRNIWLWILP